jgi:glyoxylate/hydroxypyruvate reductase A
MKLTDYLGQYNMQKQIAFVGQISKDEKIAWITHIQSLLTEINIIDIDDLSLDQKNSIKVAIVANPDPIQIAELPNLVWIQSLWAGVERLLTELPETSFKIVRMLDPNLASTMAEAVVAWTFYLHRDMPKYTRQQTQKVWQQHELIDIKDRKIGILGLGKLGKASAEKLLLNGFNVSGWSRHLAEIEGVTCFAGNTGLAKILTQSDILISLLPLTNETQYLLNDHHISLLPQGASIINFSRGKVIDETALLSHLENGHLNHAVLDVFEIEPLPVDSPLWASPHITILPHISAPTNIRTASKLVASNLQQYFETGCIPQAIDRSQGY